MNFIDPLNPGSTYLLVENDSTFEFQEVLPVTDSLSYLITFLDAFGKTITDSFSIFDAQIPQYDITAYSPSCFGGNDGWIKCISDTNNVIEWFDQSNDSIINKDLFVSVDIPDSTTKDEYNQHSNEFKWTPALQDLGEHAINILLIDKYNHSTKKKFNLHSRKR